MESPPDSPTRLPQLLTLKSMESDKSYESSSSDEDEPSLPQKTPLSEAIFRKYQQREQPSIIREEPEEEGVDPNEFQGTFRIKNLDTGEEEHIENEHQEMMVNRKLSIGRDGTPPPTQKSPPTQRTVGETSGQMSTATTSD